MPQNKVYAHAFHQTTKMQIDVGEIRGRLYLWGHVVAESVEALHYKPVEALHYKSVEALHYKSVEALHYKPVEALHYKPEGGGFDFFRIFL